MQVHIRYPGLSHCCVEFDPNLPSYRPEDYDMSLEMVAQAIVGAVGVDRAQEIAMAILSRVRMLGIKDVASTLPPQMGLSVLMTNKGVPVGFREVNLSRMQVEGSSEDPDMDMPYGLMEEDEGDEQP